MKISTIVPMGLLLIGSVVAMVQGTTAAQQSGQRAADEASERSGSKVTTPEFVKEAGAAGMAEVEMGELGSQKATNADVKAFAERMVADHTKANKELAAAAKGKGLEVPSSPDMTHKAMMEKFEHQSGDKHFDHDFMQQMVKDHTAVVELFESAANDSNVDSDFRTLAKKTLPVLQEHLKDAQMLEGKLAK